MVKKIETDVDAIIATFDFAKGVAAISTEASMLVHFLIDVLVEKGIVTEEELYSKAQDEEYMKKIRATQKMLADAGLDMGKGSEPHEKDSAN